MKLFFKRVFTLVRPYLSKEILGMLLTVLYTLAAAASPVVSKYLVDDVILKKSADRLYMGIGFMLLVCIVQPVAGYFKDLVFLNITESITLDVRRRLFSKVIRAPLSFFNHTKKGEIISRIINDGRCASEFISDFFIVFLKDIVMVLIAIGGMLYFSAAITGIVLFLFFSFFLANWRLSLRFSGLQAGIQKDYDSVCTAVNQMSDSIVTVKSFLAEDRICSKYDEVILKTCKDNVRIGHLGIILNNSGNIIIVFCICVIYGMGTLKILSDELTLGAVMAIIMYFQLLTQPVSELLNNNIQLRKTMAVFDRLHEYFEMESEAVAAWKCKLSGDIAAENVCFSYGKGPCALDNLSLYIKEKSLTALVGASGSGKSTFINLLLGFYKPSDGSIRIGGRDISELGMNVLRENISLVPQEIELFNISIRENIKCGRREASDGEMESLCKKLGLHEKIMSLPDGYDSMITERINLSVGEKQRIAIARALMKKPSVLIFDEPTSALDPENEAIIKEILKNISGTCTVIVAAHRMGTILNADQILVFDRGHIAEQGTHRSLLAGSGAYARLLQNSEKLYAGI